MELEYKILIMVVIVWGTIIYREVERAKRRKEKARRELKPTSLSKYKTDYLDV